MQAYTSVYTVEQELRQELQRQEQAKQQKQDLESRINETELRIAKLQQKSQDSREVVCCRFQCEQKPQNLDSCPCTGAVFLHMAPLCHWGFSVVCMACRLPQS